MLIPGGFRYSGADLGFNALLIAAAGTTEGAIVPWRAAFPIGSVGIVYDKVAGASSSISLQMRGIDYDGATLISGFASIANTIPDDAFIVTGNNTFVSTGGTVIATTIAIVLTAPYARFRIINNDAVNNVTVTLQAEINFEIGL